MSVDEALEVGQQCGPAVVQVTPSDPDHGPAVGREDAVAELVAITCLAAAVVGVTVELDDQTAPRPDEVAFETGAGSGDEVVSEWSCAIVLPQSGERMMFRGTEWYVMRDTRIAEVRAYYQYDEIRECELNGFPYLERGYLQK